MERAVTRERWLDWLAGTIVAVLGVPVIVIGGVGTFYGLVSRGHGGAPLPGAPPPDFLSEYGVALAFAALAVGGVLMIAVGIGVARHHQLARLFGLFICIAGIWFAWTLLQNFLRPVSYSLPPTGGSLVPDVDTRALYGSVVLGIPLVVAAVCLVTNSARRVDLRS